MWPLAGTLDLKKPRGASGLPDTAQKSFLGVDANRLKIRAVTAVPFGRESQVSHTVTNAARGQADRPIRSLCYLMRQPHARKLQLLKSQPFSEPRHPAAPPPGEGGGYRVSLSTGMSVLVRYMDGTS